MTPCHIAQYCKIQREFFTYGGNKVKETNFAYDFQAL